MSEETIPQMRERIETLTKENKQLAKNLDDVTKDLRVRNAKDAFSAAGLNPKHAELFAEKYEGDPTAEAVAEFAEAWDLQPAAPVVTDTPDEEGGSEPEPAPGSADLAQLSRSGSRSGDGGIDGAGDQAMTRDQWKDLYQRDPAAAQAAIRQGRVQVSRDNPALAKPARAPRGTNPYDS